MKFECSHCGAPQEISSAFLVRVRKAGLPVHCSACGGRTAVVPPIRLPKSDNHRRSLVQEKRVAAREGAKRQPASGSRPGYEGDIRKLGQYRGECKLTRSSGYRLQLKDLMTLERQATGNELPVFDIEFQCQNPPKRYVVLPEWVYQTLMMESGRRGNETENPQGS
jgi:hypothetical protein